MADQHQNELISLNVVSPIIPVEMPGAIRKLQNAITARGIESVMAAQPSSERKRALRKERLKKLVKLLGAGTLDTIKKLGGSGYKDR